MKLKKYTYLLLLLFFALSCSGLQQAGGDSKDGLYRKSFLEKIKQIKTEHSTGRGQKSGLEKLKEIDDDSLLPTEKALKNNLLGVIFFEEGRFSKASEHFENALSTSALDQELTQQIRLNLGSSYFRDKQNGRALHVLEQINFGSLKKMESKKYFKLRYFLGQKLERKEYIESSLIGYLKDLETLGELEDEAYFTVLKRKISLLKKEERLKLLSEFDGKKHFVTEYLTFLEAEKLYYAGNKDEADQIISNLSASYERFPELKNIVNDFESRTGNDLVVNINRVGVILPLSGRKGTFGERAMLGLTPFQNLLGSDQLEFLIEDSKGSVSVGVSAVKKLIEEGQVSAIIGGLFPDEAIEEYRMAKKYGVLFISLSQIYLPREEKGHLLVEIPGSVESLIERLFSPELIEKLGNKGAIFYPNTPRGEALVNAFWRKAETLPEVTITNVLSFERGQNDYRSVIKNFLGLKYERERQEELNFFKSIYSLEKRRTVRRIQTLKPQIDFDWVFIPTFPKEAQLLIPAFGYYDAFNFSFIGGPSWRSQRLKDIRGKRGKLFFVGNKVDRLQEDFSRSFIEKFKKEPRLIEMMAQDALRVIQGFLLGKTYTSRGELDKSIREKLIIDEGLFGSWNLNDNLWIKDMSSFRIFRGKIKQAF